MFCQKVVRKIFAKLTGKHLCQNLFFNKVADSGKMRFKMRQRHRCFSVNFTKIFKNNFFYRIPPVAASEFLEVVSRLTQKGVD